MKKRYSLYLPLLALLLAAAPSLTAQALVADDDVPGVLIAPGYDLRLGVGGLNYPSGIAQGNGTYWITEAGFPGVPPTVKEVTFASGSTEGTATAILTPGMLPLGTLAPPFTDVVFHNGMLWLAHRQRGANGWLVGAYSRFDPADPVNTFETIVTNLPSTGDHSNNVLVFAPDGRAYFGQGSATNTAVNGPDNADWIAMAPEFSEIAPIDIRLSGTEFMPRVPSPIDTNQSAVTAPYRPFNSGPVDEGFVVRGASPASPVNGIIAGSGTVYSFDPTESAPLVGSSVSSLRLEAWGLRNPFGLAFDATDSTRLFISNNGSDIRGRAGDPNDPLDPDSYIIQGNRPVANDYDDLFEITVGGEVEFFGWPDFFHDPETNAVRPATDSLFCDSPVLGPADCAGFVFEQSFRDSLTVQEAFAAVGPYVSVTGFTANATAGFGFPGDLFVTESGSFSPQTGAFTFTGHKVSRFNSQTGEKFDFLVNEGSTAEELFVPEKLNKPVSAMFVGNELAIVDLGVLEPGINLFRSGTGKVWLVAPTDPSSVDLTAEFGARLTDVTPNPAATTANVALSLERSLSAEITLHDLTGRRVADVFRGNLPAGTRRFDLPVAGLPAGTYLVRLVSNGGVLTRRFVVR